MYCEFMNKCNFIYVSKRSILKSLLGCLMIYIHSLSSEWRNGMCVVASIIWKLMSLRVVLNNICTRSRIQFSSCDYFCEEICRSTNEESSKCVGALTTYPILTSLWELVVYPRDEYSKWHNKDFFWVLVRIVV